jgi:hypothetical protein
MFKIIKRYSRDKGDIRRDKRQHAGGKKGEEASQKSCDVAYL